MYKLIILVLLTTAYGQSIDEEDLDSLLNNILGVGGNQSNAKQEGSNTGGTETITSSLAPEVITDPNSCTTKTGEVGKCVPYYLCNETDNTVIIDGLGIIDVRLGETQVCPYLQFCCSLPNKLPLNLPPPTAATVREGCGWRSPNGVGFRIKGEMDNEAKFGEFPWMVAVFKLEENKTNSQKYIGGGSLLHPSVVLTAAHLVDSQPKLRVRAGEWDTQTKDEIYPHQDRDVQEIVVHKDFIRGNLFYDIALVFLSAPMDMIYPHIGVVCLPPPKERVITGSRCQASGWGTTRFGREGLYQVIMKRVEVPVVDRSTCITRLRKTRLGPNFQLHSSFMCAGGEIGKDTCKGDGGSPLVCPAEFEKDRYIQYGIVSWGIGCGEDGTPGVYVDVANLRDWIDDKIAGRGYNLKTYIL